MDWVKCTIARKDPIITLKENGKVFRLINENRIEVNEIKVDNCLICDNRQRCDYILDYPIDEQGYVLLIELKGNDVPHAIEQLKATLSHTKSKYSKYCKYCFIISSKWPRMSTTKQKIKKDFKRLGALFDQKNNVFEFKVSAF